MTIRLRFGATAIAALGLTLAMPASAQGVLNVYCSVQVEWCTLLANEFQKASGVKVSITQKGSGETIAQLKAEAQNPKPPACWADLLKPEFKGEIQMANPNSSGTAYVAIATLVQLMGEEKAFDYLKKLHANINAYTRSGTAPMKAVAQIGRA